MRIHLLPWNLLPNMTQLKNVEQTYFMFATKATLDLSQSLTSFDICSPIQWEILFNTSVTLWLENLMM